MDFRRYATGVSVPTLNRNFIHSIMLPCPPLPEQKKIAAVLSSVQDSKEKTEAAIEATRALKKSLMKYLFTYGAVSPEEAEDVPLKETEIGMIPEEWEVAKLGDVVTRKITDGTHKTPSYTSSGIPFITATNLTDGRIDFGSCKYISQDEHLALIRRCKPEKGDILLSKVGTLGSTAMVDSDIDFSIFVQVALIKPMHRSIDSGYLKYSLTSSPMQRQIHQKSSQSTMKYIGVGKIAQLAIPLPPLPTQQHIADILSAVDHRIEAEENKRKALEALFKTLLNDLMTGSLRVNELEIQS